VISERDVDLEATDVNANNSDITPISATEFVEAKYIPVGSLMVDRFKRLIVAFGRLHKGETSKSFKCAEPVNQVSASNTRLIDDNYDDEGDYDDYDDDNDNDGEGSSYFAADEFDSGMNLPMTPLSLTHQDTEDSPILTESVPVDDSAEDSTAQVLAPVPAPLSFLGKKPPAPIVFTGFQSAGPQGMPGMLVSSPSNVPPPAPWNIINSGPRGANANLQSSQKMGLGAPQSFGSATVPPRGPVLSFGFSKIPPRGPVATLSLGSPKPPRGPVANQSFGSIPKAPRGPPGARPPPSKPIAMPSGVGYGYGHASGTSKSASVSAHSNHVLSLKVQALKSMITLLSTLNHSKGSHDDLTMSNDSSKCARHIFQCFVEGVNLAPGCSADERFHLLPELTAAYLSNDSLLDAVGGRNCLLFRTSYDLVLNLVRNDELSPLVLWTPGHLSEKYPRFKQASVTSRFLKLRRRHAMI